MIRIAGTIRIRTGAVEAARPAIRAMIEASRAEPGCLAYAYAQDLLEPDRIHVSEAWASRDALAAHFASPHIAQWRAQWSALGISDRDLTLYEVATSEPV